MPHTLHAQSIRTVRLDDNHNAFTDLIAFEGSLYLTFRICPEGHMLYPSSRITVLRSDDAGATWREVLRFAAPDPGHDLRDAHWLRLGGRLHLYVSAWRIPGSDEFRDLNQMRSYTASTADGVSWDGPTHLPDLDGHFVWRAADHAGRGYLCGRWLRDLAAVPFREHPELVQSRMLVSDDGRAWREAGLFQEVDGNETAFAFDPDGAVTAVCRRTGRLTAQLCESRPPYTQWRRRDLGRFIGGPVLTRWGADWLVGGRDFDGPRALTRLWWLRDGVLEPALDLPSGGDCSYPGIHIIDATHALVSWYSSHHASGGMHGPAAIYLAELVRA